MSDLDNAESRMSEALSAVRFEAEAVLTEARHSAARLKQAALETVKEAERQAWAVRASMHDDRDNAAAPWNCH